MTPNITMADDTSQNGVHLNQKQYSNERRTQLQRRLDPKSTETALLQHVFICRIIRKKRFGNEFLQIQFTRHQETKSKNYTHNFSNYIIRVSIQSRHKISNVAKVIVSAQSGAVANDTASQDLVSYRSGCNHWESETESRSGCVFSYSHTKHLFELRDDTHALYANSDTFFGREYSGVCLKSHTQIGVGFIKQKELLQLFSKGLWQIWPF
ncbi:Hypothetical_protein [Hexamita inflata]|uniref:Hypothetical_protein n=1 Tax=Hexamita inflata TaxID=28002 RepID=A0AA86TUI8_9EUKA|nr:Hypothetical protein HINF_LOCUS16889 [Hexamita inflata]CAI9929245.1 Hypothetical protein HINF_LOCUS16890 [Hexamita inflata]